MRLRVTCCGNWDDQEYFCAREGIDRRRWWWQVTFMMWVQKTIASPGRGILAMDESNATCGLRLASIGLENTEVNRQAYRQLLVGTPGLGEYVSGAILFEETLYQSTTDGSKMVDVLSQGGIVPGIKVDKVPLTQFTIARFSIAPH